MGKNFPWEKIPQSPPFVTKKCNKCDTFENRENPRGSKGLSTFCDKIHFYFLFI